jgi:hypothetical protein
MSEKDTISEAIAAWLNAPASFADPPEPLIDAVMPAVTIPMARKMLANKARSELYRAAGEGLLEFLKDGNKTLVTVRSIRHYQQTHWKPLFIKPVVKKSAKPKGQVRPTKARTEAAD